MQSLATAIQSAAGALQQISETAPGERGRRASTGALVLRGVEQALRGEQACWFLAVRASRELEALPRGAERSVLRRLLQVAGGGEAGVDELVPLLVEYACELESTGRLPEADAALALALSAAPGSAEVALHGGRLARKLRDGERALRLYVLARELDAAGGGIARLATIGEAAVSRDAEAALSRAIRGAIRAGDAEAAAVGLEERARVRRAAGRRHAAARDLCLAALRYPDPVDRARAAHELADLAVVMGDVLAAREALLLAACCGDAGQRDHARGRLHSLARDVGDHLGMRRWRSFKRPALVSLSLSRAAPARSSAADLLVRWREWLERPTTAPVAALPFG